MTTQSKNLWILTGNEENWRPPFLLGFSGKPWVDVSLTMDYDWQRDEAIACYPEDLICTPFRILSEEVYVPRYSGTTWIKKHT